MNKRVAIIKQLQEWGFKEKHIRMITGEGQSYVNKILNGRLHAGKSVEKVEFDEKMRKKIMAAEKFIDPVDIFTDDERQDMKYMRVLRLFMVDKETIYRLYNFYSKAKVNRMLLTKGVDITLFDSTLLGIEREIFIELIIDYV